MRASSSFAESPVASSPVKGAWLVVGLLWGVGCLNYLDRVMLNTMRDSIKAAVPMGDDDFGMLTTAFLVVYGLLSPVGGWFADRFSRRRVILLSLVVWSLVTWATSYAQTFQQLLATRVLMGVSEACYIPAALAMIADYHQERSRSFATGIHMSGLYAGMALGGMGGWVAEHHGWSASFFIFGCIGVGYGLVLFKFLQDAPSMRPSAETVQKRDALPATVKALCATPAMWIIAFQWGALSFASWAFVTWMPTFLKDHFHLTQTYAGFTATIYMQVAAFAGVLVGGAWADRWSRTQLRARAWVPMTALLLAAPLVFLTAHTDLLWVAVVGLIAFGFGRGCLDANMMPILCQVAQPQHRATGYGLLNLMGCLVGGGSAYLGGWLQQSRLELSWLITAAAGLVLVTACLLAFVNPSRRG
ncbi:MFS transporter [Prosthecobacter sp.]|uniref:MFS transporter n=1 Tax=Prosthecobacter sp. TaxID=1965333 RepID=UPI003783B109